MIEMWILAEKYHKSMQKIVHKAQISSFRAFKATQ
jgi:hypothetical protein